MTDSARTLPSRAPGLMAQEVGGEVVVVDTTTQHAHALSGLPAEVWRASESGRWTGSASDFEFQQAAAQLVESGLLVERSGLTRRVMLQRVGVVAAVGGLVSIGLPSAIAAASGIIGTPSISLSPTTGPKGTTVTVAGTNFYPSGSITSVTIGGITVAPSTPAISGTGAASFTFVVPAGVTVGLDTVSVTDNHNNTATASFTVTTPTLTLSPTSGNKGTIVTINGSGYAASSNLTVKVNGTPVSTTPTSPVTTTGGAIPGSTTFVVPAGATVGANTITVTDAAGNVGTAPYTLGAATVTISAITFAKNGSPKDFAVNTSANFALNSTLTVTVTGGPTFTITGGPPTTTSTGTIANTPFHFAYPNGSQPGQTISFTDGSGNTASVAVTFP